MKNNHSNPFSALLHLYSAGRRISSGASMDLNPSSNLFFRTIFLSLCFTFSCPLHGENGLNPTEPPQIDNSNEHAPIPREEINETENSPSNPLQNLNLDQLVELMLRNNPDIAISKTEPLISQSEVLFYEGDFTPRFTLSSNFQHRITPQNSRDFSATGGSFFDIKNRQPRLYAQRTHESKAQWGGKLYSGTEYNFEYQQTRGSDTSNKTSSSAIYSPEYSTYAGIRLKQPLLKGFGPKSQMRQIRINEINQKISSIECLEQIEKNLLELCESYYDHLSASYEFALRKKNESKVNILLEQKKDEIERGVSSRTEWLKLQSEAITQKQDTVDTEVKLNQTKSKILRLINLPKDQEAQLTLSPEPILDSDIPEYQFDRLLAIAYEKRFDFQKSKKQIDREKIESDYYQNQNLPSVDLESSYGAQGLERSYSRSAQRIWDQDQGEVWQVGLTVSLPWGFDPNKYKVEASRLKRLQFEKARQKIGLSIQQDIREAFEVLDIQRKHANDIAQVAQSTREVLYDVESQVERGVTNMEDLLKTYISSGSSLSEEIRSIRDLKKAQLKLLFVSSTLSDHLKIRFDSIQKTD